MKNRFLSLALVITMCLSLVACGAANVPDNSAPEQSPSVTSSPNPSEEIVPSEEPAPSEEPTEQPSEQPTEEPTKEPEPTHTHNYNKYQSNANGTHSVSCTGTIGNCDAKTITENCSGDPCSKCGYSVPHTHSYNSYKSNNDGTHTVTCTSTVGKCTAKSISESCSGEPCSKCGYKPIEILPNGWNGVGVNHAMEWMDPNTALDNMPNTKAVVEKNDSPYAVSGAAITVETTALCNNIIENGLVLKGFQYSSNSHWDYEAAIAMLKDVLDAESATALINWIEELDRLHQKGYALVGKGLYEGDAEYDNWDKEFNAYRNTLSDYTTMGNIQVMFAMDGNVDSFYILNK